RRADLAPRLVELRPHRDGRHPARILRGGGGRSRPRDRSPPGRDTGARPPSCGEAGGAAALVIDHPPEETPARARLRDVRPSYGATSTILTEYLRAADVKIRERLATALLYGIKTDTLHLERGATRADMEAFAYLHAHANHNALRRIERPDLPEAALDVLAKGIARRRLVDGVMLVHLGPVGYPELVAQF